MSRLCSLLLSSALLVTMNLDIRPREADWAAMAQVQERCRQLGMGSVVADVSYPVVYGRPSLRVLFYAPLDDDRPGWMEIIQSLGGDR